MGEGAHETGRVDAPSHGVIRRQAANLVSILGVLPIGLLVLDGGRDYLMPLMLYNNLMDDLDGVLAVKLGITSDFGARLDNVCDAIASSRQEPPRATGRGSSSPFAADPRPERPSRPVCITGGDRGQRRCVGIAALVRGSSAALR